MAVNDEYLVADYRHALERLLPPGKYWQEIEKDSDLDKLLYAVAEEFKTTTDDVKLNLLFQFYKKHQGWKLSDYNSLLNTLGYKGIANDNPNEPNLINIIFYDGLPHGDVSEELESYRLPHTAFQWNIENKHAAHLSAAKSSKQIDRSSTSFNLSQNHNKNTVVTTANHAIVINRNQRHLI